MGGVERLCRLRGFGVGGGGWVGGGYVGDGMMRVRWRGDG